MNKALRFFKTFPRSLHRFSTSKPGMLHGIRVLDLSRVLAAPYGTMLLGDWGAEVIKIESPDGDETRKWGPPFKEKETTYYLSINRNKKGLCLDLKTKEGVDILYALAKKSDVLIENFAPGVTDRLKIDYKTISAINPALIYASLTAYGTTGPWATKPGYDMINQAMSGLLNITGHRDATPTKVGVAITDVLAGLTLGNGILAALYERTQTGKGKRIETSLLESMLSGLVNIWSAHLNGGIDPVRQGNQHASIAPCGIYQTSEGRYIAIFCGDKQFVGLCEALGLDSLLADERFNTNKGRVTNMEALEAILKVKVKEFSFEEALKKLEEKRVPVGPVNSIKDVFASDHVKALEMVNVTDTEKYGQLKTVRNPVKVDGEYCKTVREPPTIGGDSEDILQEILGYSNEQISMLREKGAFYSK